MLLHLAAALLGQTDLGPVVGVDLGTTCAQRSIHTYLRAARPLWLSLQRGRGRVCA